MTKTILFRNIAFFGALLMITNIVLFDHSERFSTLSKIIEFAIEPITIVAASLWYKKNIVLIGLVFFFFNYCVDLYYLIFNPNINDHLYELSGLSSIIGALGLILVILAGVNKLNNFKPHWFFKKITSPTWTITLTTLVTVILTGASLLVLLKP